MVCNLSGLSADWFLHKYVRSRLFVSIHIIIVLCRLWICILVFFRCRLPVCIDNIFIQCLLLVSIDMLINLFSHYLWVMIERILLRCLLPVGQSMQAVDRDQ